MRALKWWGWNVWLPGGCLYFLFSSAGDGTSLMMISFVLYGVVVILRLACAMYLAYWMTNLVRGKP